MNFYKNLEKALTITDINIKELIVNESLEFLQKNTPTPLKEVKVFQNPSYSAICKIVPPKELPKRRDLSSKDGLKALLHSIAHIEYSAIDLALDAVYRFEEMPNEYKIDWLEVASDEIRHFKMIEELLKLLGSYYGELSVHKSLFEMAYKTNSSALNRMAIIPRYFEASGLDVNPKIISKLKNYKKNPIILQIIQALDIIYIEEIDHVKKGDKWFKYLCEKNHLEPIKTYKNIIDSFNLKSRANMYNIQARKEAGFSCDELVSLGVKECK